MINSVFYTADSFCIYTSCVQHVIENNHYPSQRFCTVGEIIIHFINNICSTLCEIIEFEDLRSRFIIVFGATMHWSSCWQNYNIRFTLWFCLNSIWRKLQIFFIFLKMARSILHGLIKYSIKYLFRKTHSTFLYSTYNSCVILKKPISTLVYKRSMEMSSIKSNLLLCSNNKIFDVVSIWAYVKWSIANSWFNCTWESFICIREAWIVQWF